MDEKRKLLGNFEKFLTVFDENSIEKMEFLIILGKLLLKIELSEITPFSPTIFSVSGKGNFPPSPWLRLWLTRGAGETGMHLRKYERTKKEI